LDEPTGPAQGSALGAAIVACRIDRGLTRSELARRARMWEETLRRYERGDREPAAGPLRRLAAALEISPERLRETGQLLAATARLPASEPLSPAVAALRFGEELGRLQAGGVTAAAPLRPKKSISLPDERARAERLVARLRAVSAEARPGWVERCGGCRGCAIVERLCGESVCAAANSNADSSTWAELAHSAARLSPGTEAESRRRTGFALAHLANAARVGGRLDEAEACFAQAIDLWEHGDPALPLDPSRIWDLLASLRRDQRRIPEALDLLDRALSLAPQERVGRILVKRARTLEEIGDYEGAVANLRRAVPLIDAEADPRTAWAARFNLCENLLQLGRPAEAAPLLPEIRELAHRLGNGLDLQRLRWLEGRIAGFEGRWPEAEAILTEVRDAFLARDIPFDTALASLELAVAQLEQGKTAEVKEVTRPLVPLFAALKIGREALAALRLFCTAAQRDAATLAEARRLQELLRHGSGVPETRAQAPASKRGA
jgi:transcriptional regulator with XRE-family HTH domain